MDLETSALLCRLLSDAPKRRIWQIVRDNALNVAEISEVTGLPQPRVSAHLKSMVDAGLLDRRRSGRRVFYTRRQSEGARQHFLSALEASCDDVLLKEDHERARALVQSRCMSLTRNVGEMERHYSPGRTYPALFHALRGLLRLGHVLDLGSGDGYIAAQLAPYAKSVRCVDRVPALVDAANERLDDFKNASAHQGDMQALKGVSFKWRSRFDAVLLLSSLCHAQRPKAVFAQAALALKPGGSLIVSTLAAHQQRKEVASFGHLQLGFTLKGLKQQALGAGFKIDFCELTHREKQAPHFATLTLHAHKL